MPRQNADLTSRPYMRYAFWYGAASLKPCLFFFSLVHAATSCGVASLISLHRLLSARYWIALHNTVALHLTVQASREIDECALPIVCVVDSNTPMVFDLT